MKAVAECAAEREPVLLCLYDVPMPAPLDAKRPTEALFGAAFVLVPEGSGRSVGTRLARPGRSISSCGRGRPRHLLAATQPRCSLPRACCRRSPSGGGTFDAPLLDGHLRVTVA